MKKTALLLAIIILVPSFSCAQGLLPLQNVLSVGPEPVANSAISTEVSNTLDSGAGVNANNVNNGIYEATYVPASAVETDPNMIPQNAAAKGQPVVEKRQPRVRIRTKQRSQGNSYWNAGGKGFKSYY